MGVMSKYNKGGVIFDVNIEGYEFTDLETLASKSAEGEVFKIDGLYINKKNKFGDHPVAIVSDLKALVDLPPHLVEDVKAMLQDEEIIEAIKAGKAGFTIRKYYQETYKKDCYGINWEDI